MIIGSAGLIVAMIAVWLLADLNTAAQVASVIAGAAGVVVLVSTIIAGPAPKPERRATETGRSDTGAEGRANTGIASREPGVAEKTGDATSRGGRSNTGVADDF
nr:hypothetical protein Ade03nite_14560 [Actinoplanes derwentensis]